VTPLRTIWISAATLTALLALLLFAGIAKAGSYEVRACDGSGINRAFIASGTAMVAANGSCNASQGGMQVRNSVGSGKAPSFSWGALEARAPEGTVITAVRGKLTAFDDLESKSPEGWRAGFADDLGYRFCGMLSSCATGSAPRLPLSLSGLTTARLRLIVVCVRSAGCPRSAIRAKTTLSNVVLELRDDAKPIISAASGMLEASDEWLSGSQKGSFAASDASGIRSASIKVDGVDKSIIAHRCDRYSMSPCVDGGGQITLNTRILSDGRHTVVSKAIDAAGNVSEQSSVISVDNEPPTVERPELISSADWSAAATAQLAVAASDGSGGSGVRTLDWELCRLDGSDCQSASVAAQSNLAVTLPAPGEWHLRLTASDALHQGKASAWSAPLRYDPVVPGRATATTRARWNNGRSPVVVHLAPSLLAASGPSGIAGYAVTTDGSDPGTKVTLAGERALIELDDLPEGTTVVRSRAISGAAVASGEAGNLEVGVDRTAPLLALTTAAGEPPRREEWFAHQLTLLANATDQVGLSGMVAASDDQPVEDGGYVEYQIDDHPEQRVRGASAEIEILDDGIHTVTARAVDGAGNASSQRSVSYRVDSHRPAGALVAPSQTDPRRLSATVKEGCIESAVMEMRRIGGQSWEYVEGRAEQRAVSALAPDDRLPAGDYEVRFRVTDCAGNEGLITQFADGSAGLITLPLRMHPTITAGIAASGGQTQQRLTTRLGSTVTVSGRLSDAHGLPIASTKVTLRERISGREWVSRASGLTDRDGYVRIRDNAGPSRTIVLVASQTRLSTGATSRSLQVNVPARVTIAAARHSLRNRQSARFSGRLYGGYLPSNGRELELQGYNPLRHGWQPVRTEGLRCDGLGRWHASYRFTATVGSTVTYRFRIRVSPRPDHPFAEGHSRSVAVRVSG
jgi:hypothetical protein